MLTDSHYPSFIKNYLYYCGSFALPCRFQNNVVYFYKNLAEVLIQILLHLYINLENTDVFTRMSLSIHEHGDLVKSSFMSFTSVYSF